MRTKSPKQRGSNEQHEPPAHRRRLLAEATDEPKRQRLADEVQRIALDEGTYVPWGEWSQPTAFRKNVRDVLKFAAPVFWNVKIA